MDKRRWPDLLVAVLLLLSVACAALAVLAGDRAARHWGPRTLDVAPGGEVWLTIDDALYIADASGRLRRRVALGDLDLPGPLNTLTPWPEAAGGERMLAGVVRLPEWLLLDGEGQVRARLGAQGADVPWGEAFHLAAGPDGRVAMATGGDHRVLLFDRAGRFLAQSAPGLFRYANGLWFEQGRWWVVDTNHGQLRLLDGDTLEARGAVAVPAAGNARFPALARRAPGGAITVSEMENDMEHGVLMDVSATGERLRGFASPVAGSRPRGFAWIGNRLLVAEAADYSVQLFDAEGRHLGPWGDEVVRTALEQSRRSRERWSGLVLAGQVGAAALGLLAIGGYLGLQRRRQSVPGDAPRPAGADTLATPALAPLQQVFIGLEFHWPAIAGGVALVVLARAAAPWVAPWLTGCVARRELVATAAGAMLLGALLALAAGIAANRHLTRRMAEPRFEALLATRAVRWFRASRPAMAALEPGEAVREVLMVQTSRLFPAFNLAVWVVTQRRLLVFRPEGARGGRLVAAVPRGSLSLRLEPPGRLLGRYFDARQRLTACCRDGRSFSGLPASPVTAQRVAALLDLPGAAPAAAVGRGRRPRRRTLAPAAAFALSLAVPGAAQLAQDRFRLGLVILVLALVFHALVTVPVLLGLVGHFYDVPPGTGWMTLAFAATWALLAAVDAGRHARGAARER